MIRMLREYYFAPCAVLLCAIAGAQTTQRVSVDSSGAQASLGIISSDSISQDGRYVVFSSTSSNLVAGDTNAKSDVFVHDRQTGTTVRVSVDSAGVEGDGNSGPGSITANGRYVVFASAAQNLIALDINPDTDIFLRDTQAPGATTLISRDSLGVQANGSCYNPKITPDGHYVVFSSFATNLVTGDTNFRTDIFVRDLVNGTTVRASVGPLGVEGDDFSSWAEISNNGQFVLFQSWASNFVAGDASGSSDVFVRDLVNATTECVNLLPGGGLPSPHYDSGYYYGSISGDGRFVAFDSIADNSLVAGVTGLAEQVFFRDRLSGVTSIVSVTQAGGQGNSSSYFASMSPDGRFVAFYSEASDLITGIPNTHEDCFVRDRQAGTTERVTLTATGGLGNGTSGPPLVTGDGRYVLFSSDATNLIGGADTNGHTDSYVRDRGAASPGTDICQPGVGGVISCPCSNPPVGAPRGCNNSSNTGGGQITSSGLAWLTADTLVFVTNGEKPTAGSILLQGTAVNAGGIGYDQGVRCVSGTIKRLYTKNAVGGSITVPQVGDPSVSAQSAALGDTISSGQYRWYAVYYRDGTVLGGCPSTYQANITQTQIVTWGP